MKTLLLLLLLVPMMSFGQNVNIPDAYFKSYLVNNTAINTNGDSEIQVSEASAFTGSIYCNGQSISDLTGIEAFTALTELYCQNNELTSLNVSNNTALEMLRCEGNNLTSLDVSGATALNELWCETNNLTSLNVFNNTALTELGCCYNQLTSLDISSNTALTELWCFSNQLLTSLDVSGATSLAFLACENSNLTSLDLSNNTALIYLNCSNNQLQCLNLKNGNNNSVNDFEADINPNLTCIEVDDVNYSTTNWNDIDPQMYFSTDCNNACSNTSSISELNNTPKQLIKIVDMLGREIPFKPNTPLLYIYDDGTVERKMVLK